jgi:uncharacterized protein (UPF0128 family)
MSSQRVCFLPAVKSGGEEMVKGELWHEIHSRFKLKETKKSIARAIGLSIQTVRKILRQGSPLPYTRKPAEGGVLEPFKKYILQRVAGWQRGLGANARLPGSRVNA